MQGEQLEKLPERIAAQEEELADVVSKLKGFAIKLGKQEKRIAALEEAKEEG